MPSIITTCITNGTPRHCVPGGNALFGAFACPAPAMPSSRLASRVNGMDWNPATGMCRRDLADLRVQKWVFAANGLGLATGPVMTQGYGRSAPIARRC
jgi:hypothetical protein